MATIRLPFYAVLISNLMGMTFFCRTFYENWKQDGGQTVNNDLLNSSANFACSLVFINRITFDCFVASFVHIDYSWLLLTIIVVWRNLNSLSSLAVSYICQALFNEEQASFWFNMCI